MAASYSGSGDLTTQKRRAPRRGSVASPAPNNALEPTPTASARTSLRLLTRLTAGVRGCAREEKPRRLARVVAQQYHPPRPMRRDRDGGLSVGRAAAGAGGGARGVRCQSARPPPAVGAPAHEACCRPVGCLSRAPSTSQLGVACGPCQGSPRDRGATVPGAPGRCGRARVRSCRACGGASARDMRGRRPASHLRRPYGRGTSPVPEPAGWGRRRRGGCAVTRPGALRTTPDRCAGGAVPGPPNASAVPRVLSAALGGLVSGCARSRGSRWGVELARVGVWSRCRGVGHTGSVPGGRVLVQADRRGGTPRVERCTHTAPNNALEPTPTAFAPASLRLLTRLTAGVRQQTRRGITQSNRTSRFLRRVDR